MSALPAGYVGRNLFGFTYPVNVIIGSSEDGIAATTFTWDFDTQGDNYAINTSFGLTPKNFYTVYYEITVTGTTPVSGTTATILLFFKDVLGLITTTPVQALPVNEYTNTGNTAVFQSVYSGYLSLDADFVPPPNETNGFQFGVSLVPGTPPAGPSGVSGVSGATGSSGASGSTGIGSGTGLGMTITRLTIQQEAVSSKESLTFNVSTLGAPLA